MQCMDSKRLSHGLISTYMDSNDYIMDLSPISSTVHGLKRLNVFTKNYGDYNQRGYIIEVTLPANWKKMISTVNSFLTIPHPFFKKNC